MASERTLKDRKRKVVDAICVILDYIDSSDDSGELIALLSSPFLTYLAHRRKNRPRDPKPAVKKGEDKMSLVKRKKQAEQSTSVVAQASGVSLRRLDRGVSGVDFMEPKEKRAKR